MDTSRRHYRQNMEPEGFVGFVCKVKETDLQIFVDKESFDPALKALVESRILFYRTQLEAYIVQDPDFVTTLDPYLVAADAPPLTLTMVRSGNLAGVGPMATVAGMFAELVGRDLLQHVQQVMVENGGDIFLQVKKPIHVAIFAGLSPFSGKIALELPATPNGYGICTSSGTVGPSLSLGRADAAVILSSSTPLADAVATAAANRIQTADDLPRALTYATKIAGVDGVLLIKGDRMAAHGNIKLVACAQ